MSYLSVANVPSFKKAIISFWFRVPQESLDKAKANFDPAAGENKLLNGIVPLVVMGQRGQSKSLSHPTTEMVHLGNFTGPSPTFNCGAYVTTLTIDGICGPFSFHAMVRHEYQNPTWTTETSPIMREQTTSSYEPGDPKDPTVIGVSVASSDPNAKPMLYVSFETAKKPQVSGYAYEATWVMGSGDPDGAMAGSGASCTTGSITISGCSCPFGLALPCIPGTISLEDNTSQDTGPGGGAGTGPGQPTASYSDVSDKALDGTAAIVSDVIQVTPDEWHHLLISVELNSVTAHGGEGDSGGSQAEFVTGACKLFIALDDKNYIKNELSADWPGEGAGDNDVVPREALNVAGPNPPSDSDAPGGEGTYSLPDPEVPSGPLGLPGTTEVADNIYTVQMAEFLMWFDQTLDTSNVENRRHFITGKGKDGRQRPTNAWPLFIPMRKFAIGDPFYWEDGADNPAFAPPLFDPSAWPSGVKGLGTADIDFTKCSWNWQMGRNIGKLRGKFEKTGKIKEYDPKDPPEVQAEG